MIHYPASDRAEEPFAEIVTVSTNHNQRGMLVRGLLGDDFACVSHPHDGANANRNTGVNMANGKAADMWKMHVVEPSRVKRQALSSAVEVANMVLRIDDIIASKKSSPSPPGGGPGGHDH